MGRGRRPGLSFVRRTEALGEEDRHSDPRLEVREAMTGPALPDVHLLRGPGDPAGHRRVKSLQTRRHRAQICTLRPRRRPAHCRDHRRQRVAREWDNGPRNWGPAGSLGCGETTPPSRSRAVSPRVAESRSSRTRWRTPTCRNCDTAATHGPLSRCSVGERNRAARSGRGHQPRLSRRTKRRPLLALPPTAERTRRPQRPEPVTANAPRPARAPESSSPALSPYRELFLLLGSTPLKVVVVVMAPRGEVDWRRENAEGDWDQPAQTALQKTPAALHEPLPL